MVRWNTFGDKPCIQSLAVVQLLLWDWKKTLVRGLNAKKIMCKCGNHTAPDEHRKNNFLLAEGKLFWQTVRTEGLWTCDTVCLKSSRSLAASQTWCEHVWELRLWTLRGLRWPLRCTVLSGMSNCALESLAFLLAASVGETFIFIPHPVIRTN